LPRPPPSPPLHTYAGCIMPALLNWESAPLKVVEEGILE
jgi:hypothetical protein